MPRHRAPQRESRTWVRSVDPGLAFIFGAYITIAAVAVRVIGG